MRFRISSGGRTRGGFRRLCRATAGLTLAVCLICGPSAATERLAVLPFQYPANPDYGVFLSDRLTVALYEHSHFEALDSLRFELVEPDTLASGYVRKALSEQLTEADLEYIRGRVDAAYLVAGEISDVGHLAIRVALVDTRTGERVWHGDTIDNPAWTWTQEGKNVGDIPTASLLEAMGYGAFDVSPGPLPADKLPQKVAVQALHTTSDGPLAADGRRRLVSDLERDGLFEVVKGTLGGRPERTAPPRLNFHWRGMARSGLEADAVLCGSLMTLGKDGTVHNIGIVSRLVEVPSGRILWAGGTSGRRIWRHDKLTDVTDAAVGALSEQFAQFGAKAAESSLTEVLADASDGAGWVRVGHAYLQRGLLQQAREAFESALTYPDAKASALNGLGLVSIRRFDGFDEGVRLLKQALEADPGFVEANANLAQAHFDRDNTTGTRYAEEAIEQDPGYARPYRILANWYERNEEDQRAVDYYRKYLSLEPDDTEVAIRFGHALGRLQDFRGIETHIEPLLRQHPEAHDLLPVLAYKDYRTGRFNRSRERFDRFLGKIGRAEREHYEDLSILLSDAYRMAYEELDDEKRATFTERFWLERDPDLTTETNERHLEHLSRVWIARRDYSDLAYPWDRRGTVYIRYGEPDYRARSGWVPSLLPPDVELVKTQIYQQLYKDPPEGELVGPVFPIRSDEGLAVRDLEEAIVDNPGGRSQPRYTREEEAETHRDRSGRGVLGAFNPDGEGYAPVTLQKDNSIVRWESWTYVNVAGGVVFDFTQEAGGSGGFDFAPLPSFAPATLKSTIRLIEYAPEIAFSQAVAASPDAYAPPAYPDLSGFEADVVDFRGADGETRVDVAYAVPAASVGLRPTSQGQHRILTRSLAVADTAFSSVIRQERRVLFGEDEQGTLADIVPAELAPGRYVVTLTVRTVGTGKRGSVTREVDVESYSGDSLLVSDLLLASEVKDYAGRVRFRRGSLEVVPHPSRRYTTSDRLSFYYEIYNLEKDAFGQTRYKVTTSVVAPESGLRGVGFMRRRRSQAAAATVEQIGSEATERSYLEVDLTEARPGVNRLVLTVEDLNGGGTVTKSAVFQVVEGGE